MKLRERIMGRPKSAETGQAVYPLRHRLLGRAALTWTERGPTLQLLRERLLSRAVSTEYEREDASPSGAQGCKTQNGAK